MRRWAPLAFVLAVAAALPAAAQAPQVRFAAGADCLTNPNCGPGLRSVYGLDVKPVFTPLVVADAGITALDDGRAEVAVAFSSNPEVSRADILTLKDDKNLVGRDQVVPVIRRSVVRRYGRDLRRRLDRASSVITTLQLRSINQQVIDGRLSEAVGAEFVEAHGLAQGGSRKRGPQIRIGYQDFDENKTLAFLYAEVLRGNGYRVTVRALNGFRPAAVNGMRRKRIDMWPGYSGSLYAYLHGNKIAKGDVSAALQRALARIGATHLAMAPGEDRNSLVMKRDTARALGISKISDLAKYWPKAG